MAVRYSLSWPVTPARLMQLIGDPDPAKADRAVKALAAAAINAWNRLSIAARLVPGTYQPAPVAS